MFNVRSDPAFYFCFIRGVHDRVHKVVIVSEGEVLVVERVFFDLSDAAAVEPV